MRRPQLAQAASRFAAGLLAAALFAGTPAEGVAADGGEQVARRAHALARDLMSPFCPGRTLADCPSPDAGALRDQIRALLSAGESEADVRLQLTQRYGDAVRAVPESSVGLFLPGAILTAGMGTLAWVLLQLSRSKAPDDLQPAEPELEADLDAELRSRGL